MAVIPVGAYRVPLRSEFRGLTARDGLILRGDAGYGEFSPFWEYDDAEAAAWLRCAFEAADRGWPTPVRDTIPVNVTVPAVSGQCAAAIVRQAAGCTTAKVKVAAAADDLGSEIERLEYVRAVLGPAGRIRIDANGAWSLTEAKRRLPILDRAAGGLEYAEQPVRSVADLAALRRSQPVPIAADESIRRSDDPLRVVRAEAADVAVLKVQPLGGVRAALRIAEQLGVPVVVSSALESSIGLAAGVALAAALPDLPYACGLGTGLLFGQDVTAHPVVPDGGSIPVAAAISAARGTPDLPAPGAELESAWRSRYERVLRMMS